MNPLELYLSRVARELRFMPLVKREEELRELRSHLEQRVEDFEAQGLKIEEAQVRATEGFGSPKVLGGKLCDAWEGTAFSWWWVALVVFRVTVILVVGTLATAFPLCILPTQPFSGLFPELLPTLITLCLSLPLGCGMLFSRWLGRRGPLIALLYFVFIFLLPPGWLHFDTSKPSLGSIPPDLFVSFVNSIWAPVFNVVSGMMGALLVHHLKVRSYRLVSASGVKIALPSNRTVRLRLSLRRGMWRFGIVFMLMALVYARVRLTLHPSTPVAALRTSLILNRCMNDEIDTPTFLELRELPAQTPAERADRERRVRFKVEVRASKSYAASRTADLQKNLALSDAFVKKHLLSSLARIKRNRHIVEGVARLVKTPDGWQVDEKSFDRSKLWSWAMDTYYDLERNH